MEGEGWRDPSSVDAIPIAPQTRPGEELPLSFAQERLWFLDRLVPDDPFYNVPLGYRVEGDLRLDLLETALTRLAERQAALRTAFLSGEGRARQMVLSPERVPVRLVDVSAAADREEQALHAAREEAARPFDLEAGRLMRATAIRISPSDHILMFTMHHIVSDGWSMGIFARELTELYAAAMEGMPSRLPPLPVEYTDFAVWQRERIGSILESQLDYWREKLRGAPPETHLPTDRPRPPSQSYRGGTVEFTVPLATQTSLELLAESRDATPFMLLLAGFAALIRRYTGDDDLCIGSPIANRNRAEIEDVIGFFVNTLVLRLDSSRDPSFAELVDLARGVSLEAYAHQDLPFERLVEELHPDRDLARQPLFQVMLVLQNSPGPELELRGLRTRPFEADRGTAKFDLWLGLQQTADGLHGTFEYSADLFDAGTIERMARHFLALLDAATRTPDLPLSRLRLLTEQEEMQLDEWNDTARPLRSACIHDLVAEVVEQAPDSVALVYEGVEMTYATLDRRAEALARELVDLGVGMEQRVGVLAERSFELVVALLAILKAGGVYVPLDPDHPDDRLEYVLRDSGASVLIVAQHLRHRLSSHGLPVVTVQGSVGDEVQRAERLSNRTRPECGMYVMYTSGSTGRPKGVLNVHSALANRLLWMKDHFDVTEDDVFLQKTPFGFDVSVWELFLPLISGARLVLARPGGHKDPAYLAGLVREWDVTLVHFVPSMLRAFLASLEDVRFPSLRAVVCSGEALTTSLHDDFLARADAELHNLYGPTEAAIDVTAWRCAPTGSGRIPIGAPIANVTIFVLDEHLNRVPVGVPGEIHIGGAGLARGYVGKPGATAEHFVPDPFGHVPGARLYRTGDVGRYRPDGNVEYLGRVDDQLKIRGVRIEPAEIEAALREHPSVRDAAVVPTDADGGRQIAAYVVPQLVDEAGGGRPPTEDLAEGHVDQWEHVFDEAYAGDDRPRAPQLNTVGWNSSYTGQPLGDAEMLEWVDSTVGQVLALRPRKVLEIGCGSGLILLRVAPHCETYWGTDLSSEALVQVEREIVAARMDPDLVVLRRQPAHDLEGIEDEQFDVVILNSVVQYFPGYRYLLRVLKGVAPLLRPGGAIFVGDVRRLSLIEPLQASIEIFRGGRDRSQTEIRENVERRVAEQQELLLDPPLFAAVAGHVPELEGAEVRLRRGRARNEMAKYRYDAVLYAAGTTLDPPSRELVYDSSAGVDGIRRLLSSRPETLAVRRIPNARVRPDVVEWQRISASSPASLAGSDEGLDPEDLTDVARAEGYEVTPTLSRVDAPDEFSAVFHATTSSRPRPVDVHQLDATASVEGMARWANDPLHLKSTQRLVDQLRGHLREKVPDYMIPSAFVLLPELPLSDNGKIDKTSLPSPKRAGRQSSTFTPPRNPTEEALATIWRDVLGLDRVGIDDNYFSLGGDSIRGIEVVARANALGYTITPRDLFRYQTVAELAAVAGVATTTPDAQEQEIVGPAPLTPIQAWFVETGNPESDYITQTASLRLPAGVDPDRLERAIGALVARHDALRLRLQREAAGWSQRIERAGTPIHLWRVDLAELDEDTQQRHRSAAVARAHKSLDPTRGLLLRAILFGYGADRPYELFLTVHHLCIDAVSWPIVLEDLAALYDSTGPDAGTQGTPRLTVPFAVYARALQDKASSEKLRAEAGWWTEAVAPVPVRLPRDARGGEAAPGATAVVETKLSEEETQDLVRLLPEAYRATLQDGLLTALSQTVAEWGEGARVLVDVESHGRGDLVPELDCSRTVGWFTSLYPVLFELEDPDDPERCLIGVKERLRSVPNGGAGFGVLARMSDAFLRHGLPAAEIRFNYLGDVDALAPRASSTLLEDVQLGAAVAPGRPRPHLLEVDAMIEHGRLVARWTFDATVHDRKTIEALGRKLVARLQGLLGVCSSPDAGTYTPADFPLARLSLEAARILYAEDPQLEDAYPLYGTQAGILFRTLAAPSDRVYVEQISWEVEDLDADLLKVAFDETVRRHPPLRTSFLWIGLDQPLQLVRRPADVPVDVRDWSTLPDDALEERADELLAEDRRRGFDLRRPPLFRMTLARLPRGRWRVLFTTHHLVLDGWSTMLVLDEIFSLYAAAQRGDKPDLPLRRPYRDFVAHVLADDPAVAEDFWKQYLAGYEPGTGVQVEGGTPSHGDEDTDRYGVHRAVLADQLWADVQEAARELEVTSYTLVQAAWGLLLSKYSRARDVVFGGVVSGRSGVPAVESIVGMLINTLPVRIECDLGSSVGEWMKRIHSAQAEIPSDHTSLALIQQWSGLAPGKALFETILAFENYPVSETMDQAVTATAALRVEDRTGYPLTLVLSPEPVFHAQLTFDRTRFGADVVEDMGRGFAEILAQLVGDHAKKLSQVTLGGEPSAQGPRKDAAVGRGTSALVHHVVEETARRRPHAVAVTDGRRAVTYAELEKDAAALTTTLTAMGVQPDTVVGLCAGRSASYVEGLLGILGSSGACLPLDPADPPPRLRAILEDADAALVVTERAFEERVRAWHGTVLVLGEPPAVASVAREDDADPIARNAAYVVYTFGGGAGPEGVVVEHDAARRHVAGLVDALDLHHDDRVALLAPPATDTCLEQALSTLAAGATLVVPDAVPWPPETFLDRALGAGVTVTRLDADYWAQAVRGRGPAAFAGTTLRLVVVGDSPDGRGRGTGAVPSPPRLAVSFGPPEAVTTAALRTVSTNGARRPLGTPLPGRDVYVLDPDGDPAPPHVAGDLYFAGPVLARGYLSRPAPTAERFRPDPFSGVSGARMYRSGDLARRLPSGEIVLVDPSVAGGVRADPAEVEAVLAGAPGVERAAVIVTRNRGSAEIVGFVRGRTGLDAAQIREFARERLPSSMAPSRLHVVDAIPLTPAGTPDGAALARIAQALEPPGRSEAGEPRDDLEQLVVRVWGEVLGVEGIRLDDNFFELGGHSLLATKMIARLSAELGYEVSIDAIWDTDSVAELCDELRRTTTA